MPYTEHALFEPPVPPDSPLFRYLDLAKFVSMLDSGSLHFSRSDRLGDEFEGSMTCANLELRPALFGGDPPEAEEQLIKLRRQSRLWTFINCWTASSFESVAMWRLYVGDGNGLAVETTFDRLREAIGSDMRVYVGRVKYTDWQRDLIPENNTLAPYVHKRAGFEYEREVRAIVQQLPFDDRLGGVDWSRPAPPGVTVPVDLSRLVVRIRLSPVAAPWYHDVVASVIERYGHSFDLAQSDLAGDPVF